METKIGKQNCLPIHYIGLYDLLYTFLSQEYLASSISFISFCEI
nr:MAG TPA: hypothetical protein [Bacteriophage sp.]DAT29125.1 MAG TPA: hypothetical protein [Caudoviricetes sp.]